MQVKLAQAQRSRVGFPRHQEARQLAGEFDAARECIEAAMRRAADDPAMSPEVMDGALLAALFSCMLQARSRKDVANLVAFQLESAGEEEFVITRGC